MPPAVELIDLVVRYGEVTAVAGVSFTAEHGEITAVLGPNGAGKTSTIETLEGYRTPTSGVARVLGVSPPEARPRIGVMLQSGGVYPTMNAAEAVRLFAAYYDNPLDADTLLSMVGLDAVARTPYRRLSGGEQQRLSLALALVGRPRVAFLDEPTAGVDPAGRILIRDVLRDLRSSGVAVVLTTHELDEAARIADQVVILDHGHLIANGAPGELMASGNDVRFSARPGLDVASLGDTLGVSVVEIHTGEYRVDAGSTPSLLADLTAWCATHDVSLGDVRAGRQTLEDVFLRLTGSG